MSYYIKGKGWRFSCREHYRKRAYSVLRAAQDELEEFPIGFYQI